MVPACSRVTGDVTPARGRIHSADIPSSESGRLVAAGMIKMIYEERDAVRHGGGIWP